MRARMLLGAALFVGALASSAFVLARATNAPDARDAVVDSLLAWRRAPFPVCADGTDNCEMFEVALVELVTRPEVWHNRRVAVSAYLHLEFEGDALYATQEMQREGRTREALWFAREGVDVKWLRESNHRAVRVFGTFRATSRGHMGLFAGSLEEIAWKRPDRRGPS